MESDETSQTGGSTGSTGASSEASTTRECPGDCDTDPEPQKDVASTIDPPDDRRLVCNRDGTPIAAGDAAGGSATVEVEPGLAVLDLDVVVRVFHERPRSVHLVLERPDSPPIDLIHNLESGDPCPIDLSVRFDDDAIARAEDYCEQGEDPAVLAPAMPIAALVGDDPAGPWTLSAIVPSSGAVDGTLETFCLALALAED
jgi:hypothetical protein